MFELRPSAWISRALILLAFFALTFASATAQVTTGNLQGVVQDPNGAAVAGATVRVTNTETGQTREVTTNEEGFYRVTNLQSGERYRVDVTAPGFKDTMVENLVVRIATENKADIHVGLAQVTEQVEVTAETPVIQSTQSQNVQNFTPQQLQQLPLLSGSIDQLALLVPGVTTPGEGGEFSNGVDISANGNRSRSNNFQIDGQDNNDNSVAGPSLSITNQEAIGDYQVITNTFSAEFGRNAGAQVNVVTRSGTNEFHGAVFDFLQNSRLNARNNQEKLSLATAQFFNQNNFTQLNGLINREGRSPFSYNRFGGRLGGPIKKNKAFFFATYEAQRQRGETFSSGVTAGTLTPTIEGSTALNTRFGTGTTAALTSTANGGGPAFAQGVGQFVLLPPVTDTDGDGVPDTFTFGPGNDFGVAPTPGLLAPLTRFRDAGGNLVTVFGGEGFRFFRNDVGTDQLITRFDFNLTNKDTLQARYIYDNSRFPLATGSFIAGALFDVPSQNNNLGVTYTRLLSATTTNEARFNFSRLNVRFGDPSAAIPGPGISFGNNFAVESTLAPGFFPGFRGFGTPSTFPQSRKVDVYQMQDTVSSTLGNHAVKFGGDIRFQRVDNFFLPNFIPTFQFRNGGTRPANTFFNANGTALTGTASPFENFILGRPSRITFALGNPQIKTNQNDYFFFVQDDWRVRPNLTLNLGLRYEISTQPFNPIIDQVTERESNPDTALFDPSFPLAFRTTPRVPIDKNNFAPRLGFAWSPNFNFMGDRFREGRTVFRANFGISYDPSFFNIVLNNVTAGPFAASATLIQTPGGATSLGFGQIPTGRAGFSTIAAVGGGDPRLFNQSRVASDFYNPYTISFGGGIQQELYRNTVLEVRYVGTRSVGQFQTINANPDVSALRDAGVALGLGPTAFTGGLTPGASFFNGAATAGNNRVDPTTGPVRTRINGASTTYHGLQTRFESRISRNFIANLNYTFSKTLDNASEIFSTFQGGQTISFPQNPFDSTSGERGLSGFHQKHVFTGSVIYELPWYRDQRGAIGKLLGGYQVTSTFRLGSGRPYTPVEAFGNVDIGFETAFNSGIGPLRPYAGNPNAPQSTLAMGSLAAALIYGIDIPAGQFVVFDTSRAGSSYTVVANAQTAAQQARAVYNDFGLYTNFGPAFGLAPTDFEAFDYFRNPFGTVGRNTYTGDPFYGVNLALFKTVKLTETKSLEFRTEMSNLLNRRNYGIPDDTFTEDIFNGTTVSTYLRPGVSDTGSARSLQFGLRFIF